MDLPSILLSPVPFFRALLSLPTPHPEIDSVRIRPAGFSVAFFSDCGCQFQPGDFLEVGGHSGTHNTL